MTAPTWDALLAYSPRADLLAGRVILVTGAAAGIGRAVARACAGHGARLVILDRDADGLASLHDEIVAAGHLQPAIYGMDLQGATPADHATLAERVGDELGRLDGLLHNAARLGSLTSIASYEPEEWAAVFQVNVHAPFMLTRACLPLLSAAPDGCIVFSSAAVARTPRAYWGAYAASLAAGEALARVLASELEATSNVRVHSLDPGPVRTAQRRTAFPAANPAAVAPPEAVTGPYLYLMGAEGRALAGQALGPERAPAAPGDTPAAP